MKFRLRRKTNRALWVAGGMALAAAARAAVREWRAMDLRDRVVFITGGSRGLGFVLAREFAHEGCRIVICARDQEELGQARELLQRSEVEVMALPCDVTQRDQVERAIRVASLRFGGVDILVNNAGVIQVGPLQSMTVEDYEQSMRTMFWGVLYPTLAVLPQMLARKSGNIVNITSIGGKVGVPHLIPYDCAKFAAVGLSEGLTAELAGKGIRVTTVVPGLMRTGSFLNAFFKGNQEKEFDWFSVSASLPLLTISAEHAARQILRATRHGETEITLSLPARILARFHGLFPGLTADVLGLINRVLPEAAPGVAQNARGMEMKQELASPLMNVLTSGGRKAADRLQGLGAGRIEPGSATTPERPPGAGETTKEPAA